ncbi:hypothetical protein EDD65_101159 [Keratinibaculum paraultunense]|uniref:Uncharacterized protein n=1 Tax=Keratinibaculum paraultunense TaxID=1278232 RepID=A0A4R3KZA9_9FIRM|nr:hypothetical protein [Keratinibaculum paraultunense]QQY80023.1 hypothetical protein JL105_01430 [Keratinibaculum paraultunense]TCS91656.1 hypothetical protein EDD65_101159 [Keratinibaculum paraultunense]
MTYKDIDLDKDIIQKNKIPLLIEDENWIKLFGDVNDKNIQYIKEELMELVKKQKELERQKEKLKKEKLHAMKMILGISDTINNEHKVENIVLLDEYKQKLEDINKELEDIMYQLEIIPQDMKDMNFELLKATVEYGYRELKTKEKKLNAVTEELETLREKLKDLINEKHDYEEWIDATYSFLHGMLGSKEMEKLDKQILDRGEPI